MLLNIIKEILVGVLLAAGIVVMSLCLVIGMNILALYMTYLFLEKL